MKKLTYILILLIILANSLFTENIKVEPIKLNYYNLYKIDSNFVITADKGFIVKYNSNTNKLDKIRVFEKSAKVITLLQYGNKYYVFNEFGEVAVSDKIDAGWEITKITDNKLLSVILWENKFIIRDSTKIFTIDTNFKEISHFPILSPKLKRFNELYTPNYKQSMTIFNSKLYVESDSNKILIFSGELKLIDSIEILKSDAYLNLDSLYYYGSHYYLLTDGEYLYLNEYVSTKKLVGYSILYELNKEGKIEINELKNSVFLKPKIIDNKIYKMTYTNDYIDTNLFTFSDKVGDVNFKNWNYVKSYYRLFNDYYIDNNFIYFVGTGGIIQRVNKDNNQIEVITEQLYLNDYFSPIKLSDNEYLFRTGSNSNSSSKLRLFNYKTDDFKKFNSISKISDNTDINDFNDVGFYDMQYDQETKKFKLLGQIGKYFYELFNPVDSLFNSTKCIFYLDAKKGTFDYERLFKPRRPNEFSQEFIINVIEFNTTYKRENCDFSNSTVMKYDTFNYWVNYLSYSPTKEKDFTSFTIADKNYRPISYYRDSSYVIDFVYLYDTKSFLLHCSNTSDSARSEIKYTTDNGAKWEYLHKYEITDTLIKKMFIQFNDRNYLFLLHFDGLTKKSSMYLDVVDIDLKKWTRLSNWDLQNENGHLYNLSYDNIDIFYNVYFTVNYGFGVDSNYIYIAIGDTLYYIQDIYNKQSWKYRVLPNNGKILDPISKIDDMFLANYRDENGYYGLSLISFPDTTLMSVEGNELEKRNYFYSYDVYPNPAKEKVTANIYWDKNLNINNAVIRVYDIYGNKIEAQENIEIIQESDWTGKLIWNCSGVPTGTYFIRIQYGTEDRVIKLLKTE